MWNLWLVDQRPANHVLPTHQAGDLAWGWSGNLALELDGQAPVVARREVGIDAAGEHRPLIAQPDRVDLV
jgi:hypothetical protein